MASRRFAPARRAANTSTLRTLGLFGLIGLIGLTGGCSSPLDGAYNSTPSLARIAPEGVERVPTSRYRVDESHPNQSSTHEAIQLSASSPADAYVRYALYNNPRVESAYQRWRGASERLPQVRALPDPRLTFGFFLDEVETRTGAQQARIGIQQRFPWAGTLEAREDAAAKGAIAAWHRFEAVRLEVAERVIVGLHDLAELDSTLAISRSNLDLLRSFEEVLRARYKVGAGSHPELLRVQVELGQLEDRIEHLAAMRGSFVASLNAELNRPASTQIPQLTRLPGRVASIDAVGLAEIAVRSNPVLLALDEQIKQQRSFEQVAYKDGMPDLTVGIDTILTDEAAASSVSESGDDPIFLSFGINVPLWREKYNAGVREAIARRLAVTSERADMSNRIAAQIQRAWFEHTDADRRVRLYERTLIPKAQESLRASLGGFRTGTTSFFDLLDTERTLLEFEIEAARSRADRGKALAQLNTLVGESVPTVAETLPDANKEQRP